MLEHVKRNTHQKQAVQDALQAFRGQHPTADQIYECVKSKMPYISRATVYRVLNQVAQEGGIQRVQIPSSADRYDNRLGPHYHMRCNQCGRIFDIDMPILEDIYGHLPPSAQYTVTGHDIVFKGLCSACESD